LETSDSEDNGDWGYNEARQTTNCDTNTPEEDWDLDLNDQDNEAVCWNIKGDGCHGNSSIYWNGENAENIGRIDNDNDDYKTNLDDDGDNAGYSDKEENDYEDNLHCNRILNNYGITSTEDSDDNSSASHDDNLPWITTNDAEST